MKKSGPFKKKGGMRGGGMAKKKTGMRGGGMMPAKKKAGMRGGGMAPAKKKAGMMGGGMAKKSGPMKKKPMMKKGGMAKKAGPMKKKVMKKGGMAKKAGPKKGMRSGGKASMRRNLRDEEARVIARQDDAADEMRRLRRKAVDLGMKEGGKAKKQGYNDRLDESLGMRNRKKAAAKKTGMSRLIPQHKRMAMGEDVLTGKMLKKKKGGQTMKSRRKESEGMEKSMGRRKFAAVGTMDKGRKKMASGGRTATTAVKLNMGAPKVKTVNARGMGAAIKGGQFRENT